MAPEAPNGERQKRALVRRLFGLAWRYRLRCAETLAWSILVQALLLSGFISGGLALDILRHYASPDSTGAPVWPFEWAWPGTLSLSGQVTLAAGFVLGFTLLRTLGLYLSRVASEKLIQEIVVNLRVQLYEKLQRMSHSYLDTHDAGGLINRVTSDAQSVRMFIQGVVVRLAIALASLLLFLGYMLTEHALLTVALLSTLPVQVLVMKRYTITVRKRFKEFRESMDRLVQTLQESIVGVKVVKGFGQETQMVDRFEDRNSDAQASRMKIVSAASTYIPMMPVAGFLQLAILLGYGGYLVHRGPIYGGIALGTLWVFLGLIRRLGEQIDTIVQTAATLPDSLTGAERVFELLDTPIEIASPPDAYIPADTAQGAIRFRDVSFRYGNGPLILENINIDVAPGETVAIVGPAGSGKTTLLQLIPRFYDVSEGSIEVDGHDVRAWDLDHLRRSIGLVFQEPFLFSNSILNNVAFGLPEEFDEDRVKQAIADAAGRDFVEGSKKGYATIVGERGLNLSGGERQRLSLARALVLAPPILLLDDTMAAVDARTEVQIQASLDRVMRGRTTLIISHRLSTLRRANRIVVVEHGRVEAVGTHEELMERNAHYREAARLQLQHEHDDLDDATASSVTGGRS